MGIILVPHTTTDWNAEDRTQGWTDIELNEQGRAEAEFLAGSLPYVGGISEIISSDLKRAVQTAEIINSRYKVPLIIDKRLRECAFGVLEGKTVEQLIKIYGSNQIKSWRNFYDYNFRKFGGENRKQVLNRHIEVIKEYVNDLDGDNILFVGHTRGLNTWLTYLGFTPNLRRGDYALIDGTRVQGLI